MTFQFKLLYCRDKLVTRTQNTYVFYSLKFENKIPTKTINKSNELFFLLFFLSFLLWLFLLLNDAHTAVWSDTLMWRECPLNTVFAPWFAAVMAENSGTISVSPNPRFGWRATVKLLQINIRKFLDLRFRVKNFDFRDKLVIKTFF